MSSRLGWRPDLPDQRDYLFASVYSVLQNLPQVVDLRTHCPPVYDQGSLGSCTGNAIAAALEYDQIKQNMTPYIPSRLFIYYNERAVEHSIASDAGAMIRDGIKSVSKQGVCPEALWPYDITKFADKPTDECYGEALKFRAISYKRVSRSLVQLKACLAEGNPFIFGISAYESFESDEVARTGIVPLPASHENLLGGHAILCVGFSDVTQRFLFRNSWGTEWGDGGYGTLPYTYLLNSSLSSDFWTIATVG
jgi:C1A family cysteine protease